MKVLIATDVSVIRNRNEIWVSQKHSSIFKRYYESFGKIILFARCMENDSTTNSFENLSDIFDSLIEIDSLYKVLLNQYNHEVEEKIKDCDLVIGRCPSFPAYKAFDIARRIGKPFLAESMGDAWDAYWNNRIAGKLIAPYVFFKMKKVVRDSDYAVYVTSRFLQRRYPCKNNGIAASNVLISNIDEDVLVKRFNRIDCFNPREIILMTTAAVDVKYKGQQYVIKSIPKLNKKGIRVKYYIVGEGKKNYLESIVKKYNVKEQVVFTGRIPLEQVLELLDGVDIYLQPSLQEGLPRSVIEAMSRGCACIGARTAGIPELLEDEMVVKQKNVSDIVETILYYCALSEKEKKNMARRNWEEAKQYDVKVLDDRRKRYFNKIKEELKISER